MRKVFSNIRVYGRPARPACRRIENTGNNMAQHKHRATPATRSNVRSVSLLSAAVASCSGHRQEVD